mmetsp:Transcript_40277/g.70872  ORF Transcript_40277/g.70872 Transcript_40277/m.70872 type:complete len:257 (+) Transcript_40277:73-843(+)
MKLVTTCVYLRVASTTGELAIRAPLPAITSDGVIPMPISIQSLPTTVSLVSATTMPAADVPRSKSFRTPMFKSMDCPSVMPIMTMPGKSMKSGPPLRRTKRLFPNARTIATATIRTPALPMCVTAFASTSLSIAMMNRPVRQILAMREAVSTHPLIVTAAIRVPMTHVTPSLDAPTQSISAAVGTASANQERMKTPTLVLTTVLLAPSRSRHLCAALATFKMGTCLTWKPRMPILPSLPSRSRFTLLEMPELQRCG